MEMSHPDRYCRYLTLEYPLCKPSDQCQPIGFMCGTERYDEAPVTDTFEETYLTEQPVRTNPQTPGNFRVYAANELPRWSRLPIGCLT